MQQSKDLYMQDDWYDDETTLSEEYSIKEYDVTASPNDFNLKTLFDFYLPQKDQKIK